MPKRKQDASSSSGRNEAHNPNVQASGDRLQSTKDYGMTKRLLPGVKLLPNLVVRIEENFKNTFGHLICQIFQSALQHGVFAHGIALAHRVK